MYFELDPVIYYKPAGCKTGSKCISLNTGYQEFGKCNIQKWTLGLKP